MLRNAISDQVPLRDGNINPTSGFCRFYVRQEIVIAEASLKGHFIALCNVLCSSSQIGVL